MTPAREALAYELRTEYGEEYAGILAQMVALSHRTPERPPARRKKFQHERAGMRRALVITLRVRLGASATESAIEKLIKTHEEQWLDAIKEDEEWMRRME